MAQRIAVFMFIIIWIILFPVFYRALSRVRTETLFKESSPVAIKVLYLSLSFLLSFGVARALYLCSTLIMSVL